MLQTVREMTHYPSNLINWNGIAVAMKEKPHVEEGVIRAQLEILESVYGIQILNINELISWILEEVHTDHEVYGITAALNTWLAMENLSGPVRITESLFRTIADMIQKKEEFLH